MHGINIFKIIRKNRPIAFELFNITSMKENFAESNVYKIIKSLQRDRVAKQLTTKIKGDEFIKEYLSQNIRSNAGFERQFTHIDASEILLTDSTEPQTN